MKELPLFIRIASLSVFLCLLPSCNEGKDVDCKSGKKIKIIPVEINSDEWGFDIMVNDKKYIHQPVIPAIIGNSPFRSKEDALKVGALMKYKICNNMMPPSISVNELDSLKIKRN